MLSPLYPDVIDTYRQRAFHVHNETVRDQVLLGWKPYGINKLCGFPAVV